MKLTPAQEEAVQNTTQSVAVIAGAGSGKTKVLTEHFRHLIVEHHVPLYRIAAFTFTEKAAGQIKERILEEGIIRPEEEVQSSIGTIHSFCSRLLRRYGPLLHLDPAYNIVNETDSLIEREEWIKDHLTQGLQTQNPIIRQMMRGYGFERTSRIYHRAFEEPAMVRASLEYPLKDEETQALMTDIQSLFSLWMTRKISLARLHFDDLEILTIQLLTEHPQILKELKTHFTHILVDEFQDTSPLQSQIFNLIFEPPLNRIFIVGDPKQSIYRFRRADISLFREFVRKIQTNQGKIVQLSETFRIPPQITLVINKVFSRLFENEASPAFREPMLSRNTDRPGIVHVICASRDKEKISVLRQREAQWIAQTIVQMNLSPDERSKTALLFRSGAPMSIYRETLTEAGIPCQVTRTENLLHQKIIRDLFHVLAYLAGKKDRICQVGILRSIFFNFSEDFIERFTHGGQQDFLAPYISDLFLAKEDSRKWEKLRSMIERWEGIKNFVPLSRLVRMVLKDLGCDPQYDDAVTKEALQWDDQTRLHVDHWVQLIDSLEAAHGMGLDQLQKMIGSLKDNDLEIRTLDLKSTPGRIQLMTIHSAKGLEFDRVFLPQLYASDKHDPTDILFSTQTGPAIKKRIEETTGLKFQFVETPTYSKLSEEEGLQEEDESKRLLYVAMTRAREEVFLFLREPSKEKLKLSECKSWSDWLWILLEEERLNAIPLPSLKEGRSTWLTLEERLNKGLEGPDPPRIIEDRRKDPLHDKPTITASQIESYFRCEKEYQLKYLDGIDPVTGVHEHERETRLRGRSHSGEAEARKQQDLQGIEGRQWGSLVHEVLQYINWDDPSTRDSVIDQAMTNRQLKDHTGLIRIRIKDQLQLLEWEPSFQSIVKQSGVVYKEVPFILDFGGFYLRGNIDHLTQTEKGWVIVDYKTDFVQGQEEVQKRVSAYEGQMACYAIAVSRIMDIKEIRTVLVFTQGPFIETRQWDVTALEQASSRIMSAFSGGIRREFRYPQDRSVCNHCPYFRLNYCGVKSEIQPSATAR